MPTRILAFAAAAIMVAFGAWTAARNFTVPGPDRGSHTICSSPYAQVVDPPDEFDVSDLPARRGEVPRRVDVQPTCSTVGRSRFAAVVALLIGSVGFAGLGLASGGPTGAVVEYPYPPPPPPPLRPEGGDA